MAQAQPTSGRWSPAPVPAVQVSHDCPAQAQPLAGRRLPAEAPAIWVQAQPAAPVPATQAPRSHSAPAWASAGWQQAASAPVVRTPYSKVQPRPAGSEGGEPLLCAVAGNGLQRRGGDTGVRPARRRQMGWHDEVTPTSGKPVEFDTIPTLGLSPLHCMHITFSS